MSHALVEQLQATFGDAVHEASHFRGDDTVIVDRAKIVEICAWLKNTCACNMMLDICGVDCPEKTERFEVVYHLYSTTKHHRIRLKVRLTADDAVVDTVTSVWRGADWFERECFDLFGVQFAGHPNLKRLLTFETFEGHALRKDYPINQRPRIPTPDTML